MPSLKELEARFKILLAKDMLRRGHNVQAAARRNLSGANGHIKRVDTGDLRSSIQVSLTVHKDNPAVRVGTNRKHGRWVHDGTGIYGPQHRPIVPRSGRVLVFKSKMYGAKTGKFKGKVVVRSVKGMRPNRFLSDALYAAKD